MQLKINGSDDIIQARTQATAGDDGNLGLGRFEEDLLARAGPLEGCTTRFQGVTVVHLIANEQTLDGADRVQPQG